MLDRRDGLFLALLMLAALPVYAWNLNARFTHDWETHGPQYMLHAINFDRFGTVPLEVSGRTLKHYPDPSRHVAVNHPPLADVLLTISYRLVGKREAAYRGPLILFTLLSLVALLSLLRSLFDRPVAWTATALYAFTPMVAYYSIVNPHLALTMLFIFTGF